MRTIKDIFKSLSRLTIGLLLSLGVAFIGTLAYGATVYPAGSLLQPSDVTSSHIRNYTIQGVDVSPTSAFTFASTTVGTFVAGTINATSTLTVGATTTLNGVAYTWPSTAGTSGYGLQTNGAGSLSWAIPDATQLNKSYTAGETIATSSAIYLGPVQPVFVATSTATGTGTTLTWSHTNSTATNQVLVVSIGTNANDVTGVTYNGVAMTRATNANSVSEFPRAIEQWYLVAPSTGAAYNIVVSSTSGSQKIAQAVSYSGIDQTTPINATTTAQGATNFSLSLTTTSHKTVLISSFVSEAYVNAISADARDTALPSAEQATANLAGRGGYRYVDTAQATTTSYTFTGGNQASGSMLALNSNSFALNASAANASSSDSFIGFAQGSATAGNSLAVTIAGVATGFSNLSAYMKYHLANAAGAISIAAGTVTRKVCISVSTTECLITNIW